MRYVLLLLALGQPAYALDGCPGAKWTPEEPSQACVDGIACFGRKILSTDGVLCGSAVHTAYEGYFTVSVRDQSGKEQVLEKYVLDDEWKNVDRVEVYSNDGQFLYYTDSSDQVFLPTGEGLPKPPLHLGGAFYEQAVELLYQ